MLISYNEACAKDCSTLEQDLELCERAGFDCIELRLDMLRVSSREYAQAAMTSWPPFSKPAACVPTPSTPFTSTRNFSARRTPRSGRRPCWKSST